MQLESIEIQKQPVDTEDFQQLDVDFPITSAVDKSSVTSSSQKVREKITTQFERNKLDLLEANPNELVPYVS